MGAFAHITTLLSFVFALALTHLLASATRLVLKRKQVRFSWTLAFWMMSAMALLLLNWLSLYDDRGLPQWDIVAIGLQFLFTVLQYFTCSLVSPDVPDEGVLDMWQFHEENKAYYLGAIAALGIFAVVTNAYFQWKTHALDMGSFLAQQIELVPLTALVVAGIFVKPVRLQFVIAAIFLTAVLATLALFTGTLT